MYREAPAKAHGRSVYWFERDRVSRDAAAAAALAAGARK
jgi:hypothetical protein